MTATQMIVASDRKLTKEQQAAVDSSDRALIITAPAGTGKTEVLVRRADQFIRDPANGYARVLVVTYTTRAAREFTTRLRDALGAAMDRVQAETLHGFAQSLLSIHGSHVGLPGDFEVISRDEDRADLLAAYDPSWQHEELELFRELDLARAKGTDDPRLNQWRAALEHRGAVDFGEMIAKATEALRVEAISNTLRKIYGLVLVDEAQNLTYQQYQFLAALIGSDPESKTPQVSTTLLGDPNQLVTGFAGGDSGLMKRFEEDFGAKRLALSRNFRSSKSLSRLERIVSGRLGRASNGTSAEPHGAAEGIVKLREYGSEDDEAKYVARWVDKLLTKGLPKKAVIQQESRRVVPEDIAVLARSGAALNAVSEEIVEMGHEVARAARSDDDYMSSDLGKLALLLLRLRSDRHKRAAEGELKRQHGIDLPTEFEFGPASFCADMPRLLCDTGVACTGALVPLAKVESPQQYIEALNQVGPNLSKSEPSERLAGWLADRRLIQQAWKEFVAFTPTGERLWTQFALFIDRAMGGRDLGSGVRLLTVHKAQGREFKAVAIVAMNDGQFPDFRAESEDDKKAELQTFYVAATRASRMLLLTRARVRDTRYGPRDTEPSPYWTLAESAARDS